MRIFITGATGFIGQFFVERLAATPHEAHCLVRPGGKPDRLRAAGAHLVKGDIGDKASLLAGMRGCDWVVHLANVYSLWERDPAIYWRVNVDGTRNVMEAALEAGVAKVAHVSSVAIFGVPAERPFTEETPPGPERLSEYARSKYAGDEIVWKLRAERGLPVVVLYPSAVIGPGDPKPTGNYARDVIAGRVPGLVSPNSVISYVDVRDVAEGMLRALEKEGNLGQKYILAAHRVSLRQHTQALAAAAGVRAPSLPLPDGLLAPAGWLATWLANLTGRPPILGMASDALRANRYGFAADGSKAERALGLTYRPYEITIREMVASLKGPPAA